MIRHITFHEAAENELYEAAAYLTPVRALNIVLELVDFKV